MYKIQSVNRINKELLVKCPDAKEQIISNMLVDFAHEMFENKCFEITETNIKSEVTWMQPDEQEFRIESFVMTPKEFKEAIETLHLIKSALPAPMKGYANHLHTLLTKQPVRQRLFPVNTVLHTKDGRIIGNAIIIGHEDKFNVLKTDYGNTVRFTDEEIKECFYIAYSDLTEDEKQYMRETLGGHKHSV